MKINQSTESILITGGAGFIGSHLCEALVKQKKSVVILDNFDPYYDPAIKRANIATVQQSPLVTLIEGDIRDKSLLDQCFKTHAITTIVHLAAMAGVRPSIENPELYVDVNINGTQNILECAKTYKVQKILFASSSSVYGNNHKVPFSESDSVDHPISPYAATKKAGELLCYTYHHLYKLPIACLRFFTVYGPRQRPEMAIHKFAKHILNNDALPVFNNGRCERDYTYIEDIIQGILKIADTPFTYDIINLGESKTISTADLITLLEKTLGKTARRTLMPSQPGDVEKTFADISHAKKTYGYTPNFSIEDGIKKFCDWVQKQN